ncbi:DUF1648 domain-containing protein [Brevibacillus parabrevis]|uniref:DUF1648 domain-containing protein n=1 Tax=Brevibacillus parabrevis TaxID=54914 RepID=UPI001F600B18|nr:DUF1648 domain-containing protein [Brevibacillus parabrevis]
MSDWWGRPKIEIAKSKSEWIWDILGAFFYIGGIVFLLFVWGELPDKVPAHFDAVGEVDRWGSKWELLILPGIGAFIFGLMQLLEKHPEVYNYPKRFNESNAEQFYLQSRKIVNQLKNMCLIVFSAILLESVSIAMGWGGGFGKWFLPVVAAGIVIQLVYGFGNLNKIR